MKIEFRQNRSNGYRFTLIGDYSEVASFPCLIALKESIKGQLSPHGYKQRVEIRGRRPKVKMHVSHCLYGKSSTKVSYGYGGNIIGGLKNATEFDVYVYERY